MPPPSANTPFWLKPHWLSGGWLTWLWPSMPIVVPRNVAATARTSADRNREQADGAADAGPALADATTPLGRKVAGTLAGAIGRAGELPQPARTVTTKPAATAAAAVPRRRTVMCLMRTPWRDASSGLRTYTGYHGEERRKVRPF